MPRGRWQRKGRQKHHGRESPNEERPHRIQASTNFEQSDTWVPGCWWPPKPGRDAGPTPVTPVAT
jgi:hypothetical protein